MRSDRDGSRNTRPPVQRPLDAAVSVRAGNLATKPVPVAGFSLGKLGLPLGNKARVSGIRCHGPSDEKSCKNVGMGAAL
jgi:hypothetical protein